MTADNNPKRQKGTDLKNPEPEKKAGLKKLCCILAALAAIFVFFAVTLLYKPSGLAGTNPENSTQVNEYITHVLSPQLYNGAQRQEPFEITIPQNKTKNIVALADWPQQSGLVRLFAPNVYFVPDAIVLITAATIKNTELAITIAAEPSIDRKGLLNLHLTKVKIGAVNATFPTKIIARKMYSDHLAAKNIDTEKIGAKIAAALLNDQPFEPVFKIEDKKVHIKKIPLESKKLTISFVPADKATSEPPNFGFDNQ